MSMHYHMPGQAVPATSWMLFCPDCSQKMRIIMAAPAQDGRETRTYECAYGHPGIDDRGPSLTRSCLRRSKCSSAVDPSIIGYGLLLIFPILIKGTH